MKLALLPTLICILAATPVCASDLSIHDLLSLDIETLSQVQVYSASKKNENISEAPSIVSVVTADEIARYGGLNLYDVFNRVPSLQVLGSTADPNNAFTLRAATNQHYTNRVLMLIDGRPVRDGYAGSLNFSLFLEFPVSIVEQIEIIRGPGSVLYGTNAFSGVINIVTRAASEQKTTLSKTHGSFDHNEWEGASAYSGEDWSLFGSFKTTDTDGERFTITDEANVTDSYESSNHGYGYFVKGHYKNLSAHVFKGRSDQESLGIFGRFPASKFDGQITTMDVGYAQELSKRVKLDTHLTYNRLRSGEVTDAPEKNKDDLLIAEASLQSEITDSLNLLTGGSFEHKDGVVADRSYQQHLYNAYAQLDWQATEKLKLVGGLQLNDAEEFNSNISPRLAAIYNFSPYWGLKVLYGEAFRSAAAIESELSIPNIIVGDTMTQPERISTLESQIFYSNDTVYTALSAYQSRIEDIIGRISNPSAPGFLITNTGEQTFKGVEFEAKLDFKTGLQISGSASYQKGESDTGIDDPTFAPNVMAKLGVSYKTPQWTIGVFDSWYGDPEDIRTTNPAVLEVNDQPKSYHLVSANVEVRLNEALNLPSNMPKMKFTLYGENLLDEDIDFPEYNRKNINSFPIDNGRAAYARLTLEF
jgi:outer membrane receptor for ferrienterochelin and colicin